MEKQSDRNINDKLMEKNRYDSRALAILKKKELESSKFGSASIPLVLRSPYLFYEEKIKELLNPSCKVLEIGSGTGLHTYSLIKTGAHVTATDISPNSLKVLEKNLIKKNTQGKLVTMIADMEQLPFENKSFDVVTSVGSISYGDEKKVDSEIHRIIKPTGYFICVDSLNNNPIYRLNRYIHYLKKERSKQTLLNMPTIQRIVSLTSRYKKVEVKYFGSIQFMTPLLSKLLGSTSTTNLSNKVDKIFNIKKSAFKFVLTAQT